MKKGSGREAKAERKRNGSGTEACKKKAGKEEYSKQMETERKRSASEPDRDRQKAESKDS